MTDITKLADKWRRTMRLVGDINGYDTADELEQALPVWTRITDDPETWPENGQRIVYMEEVNYNPKQLPDFETWETRMTEFIHHWRGTSWRATIDLDYPPDPTE